MRALFAIAFCASLATPAAAQDEVSNNIVGQTVVLRALDKVTATTKDYTVQIGDTLQYGSLSVDVKHCEKKPPEDIPETYAFLQISDNRMDGRGEKSDGERLFS